MMVTRVLSQLLSNMVEFIIIIWGRKKKEKVGEVISLGANNRPIY